jgi:hypothetical protein
MAMKVPCLLAVAGLAGCPGADAHSPGSSTVESASGAQPEAACSDHDILARTHGDESTRAELAHLHARYRDVDASPTPKVNVKLATGAEIAPLARKHGARAHQKVADLPGWYTLTFDDLESALAAVRPLLCDADVARAALNLERPYRLRLPR